MNCHIQPCEGVVRWWLEHRGFRPTHRQSCKQHLSDVAAQLISEDHGQGVVMVSKWGNW